MVITGYRIHSTDFSDIELEINRIRHKLRKVITKTYHKKLGEEIAFLCDNVALGILQRDPNESIYDSARRNLDHKLKVAALTGAENEYNLQVYAHVMTKGEYTYLQVICPNVNLLTAFKGLEFYSLNEEEAKDRHNAKTEIWVSLQKEYEKNSPMQIQLSDNEIEADPESIVYPDINDRCNVCARHNILNRYLNQIAGGEQIPPFRLMEYMDTAMSMLLSKSGQAELTRKTMELKTILVDLSKNTETVFRRLNEPIAEDIEEIKENVDAEAEE